MQHSLCRFQSVQHFQITTARPASVVSRVIGRSSRLCSLHWLRSSCSFGICAGFVLHSRQLLFANVALQSEDLSLNNELCQDDNHVENEEDSNHNLNGPRFEKPRHRQQRPDLDLVGEAL